MKPSKILIAYYSKTDNTETIAKYIQDTLGGDLLKIEPLTAYPDDYRATTEQAKKEINAGFLPPLKTKINNLDDYDIVFIGSPCWWGTIAPPVSSFLSQSDLSGKTVIPFSTHGGSGLAENAEATAKLAKGANTLEGKAFFGSDVSSAKTKVEEWLRELKL